MATSNGFLRGRGGGLALRRRHLFVYDVERDLFSTYDALQHIFQRLGANRRRRTAHRFLVLGILRHIGQMRTAPGSPLKAPRSRLPAQGSPLKAPRSRLPAQGSPLQARRSRLPAPGSPPQAPPHRPSPPPPAPPPPAPHPPPPRSRHPAPPPQL